MSDCDSSSVSLSFKAKHFPRLGLLCPGPPVPTHSLSLAKHQTRTAFPFSKNALSFQRKNKILNVSRVCINGQSLDFPGGSDNKASACNAGDRGSIPGSGGLLEKEMAPHSSTVAWRIPWTEKPGRLQSMGSHRVGHD